MVSGSSVQEWALVKDVTVLVRFSEVVIKTEP